MPFTDNGYETRRFNVIREQLRESLETELGTPINSEPDTVMGTMISVFANQLSIQENDVQALSNNLDIYKAEGVYLDRLVRYIGLTRLAAAPASGVLKVWRDSQDPITSSLLFSTSSGTEFTNINNIRTSLLACTNVILAPETTVENVIYTLSINGAIFTKTSLPEDTEATIVDYFVQEITNFLGIPAVNDNNRIKIDLPDTEVNTMSITTTQNFSLVEVAAYNDIESVEKGLLQVTENTITQKVSNEPSILRVNNPLDSIDGRDLETDEELRKRYEVSFSQGGNSTYDAIVAALLQLPNVTGAVIIENDTVNQVNDLPAKSYKCIVADGNPTNIADAVWSTKPVGVETIGDITSVVRDVKGNLQNVHWSRPTEVFIFVEVTYSLYDEEIFPSNGETLIKESILNTGQGFSLDNDVIPNRFIGDIYRTVEGIDSLSIRVGYSTDVNNTLPASGWMTTRIPISQIELPVFTQAKIEVVAT